MSEQPITWVHRGTLEKLLRADGLIRCSECHQAGFTMAELAQLGPCEAGDGRHRVQMRPTNDGLKMAVWCRGCVWWSLVPHPDGDLGELALHEAIKQHLGG